MSNPVIVDCPADQWTKVCTNSTQAMVNILKENIQYKQTYRETGDDPPTDIYEGVTLPFPGGMVSRASGVDVYIWPVGAAGKVRVDE